MAKIINIFEFKNEQRKKEIQKMLFREDEKMSFPEHLETYSWVLERVRTGKCILKCPDKFDNFPCDKNPFLEEEWFQRLDDRNYICAIFLSPQHYSNLFYVKDVNPTHEQKKETAYMVEQKETVDMILRIRDKYGLTHLATLSGTADSLANRGKKTENVGAKK